MPHKVEQCPPGKIVTIVLRQSQKRQKLAAGTFVKRASPLSSNADWNTSSGKGFSERSRVSALMVSSQENENVIRAIAASVNQMVTYRRDAVCLRDLLGKSEEVDFALICVGPRRNGLGEPIWIEVRYVLAKRDHCSVGPPTDLQCERC